MPLTNIEIKNAQLKEKEYLMSDGAGLVVLIKPSGAKLWRFRYTMNGRKQKLSLGAYPDISLALARIKAADARAKLAKGISPVTVLLPSPPMVNHPQPKVLKNKRQGLRQSSLLRWREKSQLLPEHWKKRIQTMRNLKVPPRMRFRS
ncbi:Arm DNA-binding domain-containing protein [Superficieibacter sp.]|uniref:Arm DNA-binding domain-containing protein n=1 Tax=Superficieibacter sp. TaxID=2303322 RepID=UPI0028B06B7B|nr:Arm DNA-binding domain-containing protein [Superficieibacter sp.]